MPVSSIFSPATGYPTAGLLQSSIKKETSQYLKKGALEFASFKTPSAVNGILGQVGGASGLAASAVNQSVAAARSASDKLNGALGGKLSSVLGAGIAGQSIMGGVYGAAAGAVAGATKQISNLATGAVSSVQSLAKNKLGATLSSALGSAASGLLGNALSQVSDTGAKNLASARLAPGFLETGPRDTMLAVDVYGVSDGNILNTLGDKVSGFAKDAFNDLRQSTNLVTDLTSMLVSGGTNYALSKEGLTNRVLSSLGGKSGIIRNLSDSLRGTIVNGVGLPAGIYDTAVAIIGDQATSFNAGHMDNARDVFSLVNTITRSSALSGFFDIGSESSLMAGVMREAIALGVSGAIDVLVEKSPHDEVAYNALYANMQVAVEYSDLDTINTMIDKLGVNTYLAQVPDAVAMLLSRYELPSGTTSEQYDLEWAALKRILDRLRPDWGRVQRDTLSVSALSFYTDASADAKTLLMREDDHMVETLIGSTYSGAPDLISELRLMYPLLPLAQTVNAA